MIANPILPGFNPDPSITRVGDDYYIATSTFEWFPGVQIHHSRDLANWTLLTRPLDRLSQLDMIGNPDSGGVWAPCLSYSDGLFYLVYTDVKQWTGTRHKITHNYLVTATDITGPWSDPTYLDSSGFDASLFHDANGRKWYLSMIWDHRLGKNQFAGTLLQEYDPVRQCLIGPQKNIFRGSDLKLTEGPHLYQKDGYYYLLTAEGGTSYEHAVTLARSRDIFGPYELDPDTPAITSRYAPEAKLQKAGHASLVQTPAGEWFAVHLCGRPIAPLATNAPQPTNANDNTRQRTLQPEQGRRCILGRETAIQKLDWPTNGWPRLAHGGQVPDETLEHPASNADRDLSRYDDFESQTLDIHFQSLRRPINRSWLDLKSRPGWLRLYGQEPTTSTFRQSLIARRIQSFHTQTSAALDFSPQQFKHAAGLVAYYDTCNHYYLRVSRDESLGRHLGIIRYDAGIYSEFPELEISLPEQGTVYLRVTLREAALQFSYSLDPQVWQTIGPVFDSTILSDDYHSLGFTGAFVGLAAQDLTGQGHPADFDWFDYREL
ncbi:glycoside hydrolase family 43 protein [Pelagicoccus sp. SDUM812005]|uniref:glycoside hydrolase family 43 protein n=1 Tax=Pelagicoccus sp. SDUM812005 TaxID=3041257 RepID=UPI00280C7C9E|nr:glycoside hydrolase family 43 protein [Pelagicoccus sp. SDUM812005]MDQ8182622.1 glycoside hydrolase family 43 protein [Pelagicoccus sp. SDUM812005]